LKIFNNAKPALLLAMFIALVLNILGHVTCLNLLLKTMLGNASEGHDELKRYIPCDIRSVPKPSLPVPDAHALTHLTQEKVTIHKEEVRLP
jgi:hypothetical protein